jgi:hypothetical protein
VANCPLKFIAKSDNHDIFHGYGIGNGNVASIVIGYCVLSLDIEPIPIPGHETLPIPIPKTKKLLKGTG